jgi:hypothetical protein
MDYLAPIARKMIRKYKYDKMSDRLNLGEYSRWNDEGYQLLNTAVYTSDLVRGQMPSNKYKKRAFAAASEGIALAGYRLGATFNDIFGVSRETE